MRRGAFLSSLLVLPLVAACAGGPGAGGSAPAVLAYAVPDGGSAAYSQVDSVVISIDAGGQMIDVNAISSQVIDMAFANNPTGVQVTATWRELDATVSNPMGAPERAGIDDVEGALVFTMDAKGKATQVSAPDLSGNAEQMVSPAGVTHGFFPRLNGQAPTPGMTWTDTIAYEADEGDSSTIAESIVTYTVAGETTVNGMTLLKVDMVGSDERTVEGMTVGMDFIQTMEGEITGYFLWDLQAGKLHSQSTELELMGTMEVAAAPFPLDVMMRGKSSVTPAGN